MGDENIEFLALIPQCMSGFPVGLFNHVDKKNRQNLSEFFWEFFMLYLINSILLRAFDAAIKYFTKTARLG